MLWFFAPVGLLYGALAYALSLLRVWLPVDAVAVVVVGAQLWVSGFLHVDGWADVWDAWAAPPERRRHALKSPTVGAAGAMSLVLAAAALLVGTAEALHRAPWAVWLAPVAGRVVMAGVVEIGPVHPESRLLLAARTTSRRGAAWFGAGVLGLAAALGGGGQAVADAGVAAAVAAAFAAWAARWLDGINGDVAGAAGVLAEMVVLWGGAFR
jgi:adenosylcobinamide-GDP ribazoletransferase